MSYYFEMQWHTLLHALPSYHSKTYIYRFNYTLVPAHYCFSLMALILCNLISGVDLKPHFSALSCVSCSEDKRGQRLI